MPSHAAVSEMLHERDRADAASSELSDYRARDRFVQEAQGELERGRQALCGHVAACTDPEAQQAMTTALDAINRAAEALDRQQA